MPWDAASRDELIAVYRDGLLNDTLPFWIRHCVDDEHGGFMTSLDRDGSIIDTEGEWITKENELFVPYKRESEAERNIVYRPGGPRITAKAVGIPVFNGDPVDKA